LYITRKEMLKHLKAYKHLPPFKFSPAKKGMLPKPLNHLRSSHYCTDLLNLGSNYRLVFVWKDNELWERRAINAYFFLTKEDNLYPLARIDYHPSHKELHIHISCEDMRDLTNRNLAGIKEFNLKLKKPIDPAIETDRMRFVNIVSERLGIQTENCDDE